ncbi:MAG: hypothetical protein OES26_09885 [Gammaproteobacteria bacterium]|nr:hypothetical protein [Gammaproteobacteria bacterium]
MIDKTLSKLKSQRAVTEDAGSYCVFTKAEGQQLLGHIKELEAKVKLLTFEPALEKLEAEIKRLDAALMRIRNDTNDDYWHSIIDEARAEVCDKAIEEILRLEVDIGMLEIEANEKGLHCDALMKENRRLDVALAEIREGLDGMKDYNADEIDDVWSYRETAANLVNVIDKARAGK